MIDSVRFRNFKALRHVELSLGQLTVLAGPNAAGKSSVLEGIHLLTQLSAQDPREVFRGQSDVGLLASRGAEGALELQLVGSFRNKRGILSITFAAIEDYPFTAKYMLEAQWGDRQRQIRRELHPAEGAAEQPPIELPLGSLLRRAALLELDHRRLAEPSFSELPTPLVGPDGAGLSAVIADLAASRPDNHRRLFDALRAVFPEVERVRLVRAKVDRREVAGSDLGPLGGRGVAASRETVAREAWGHEIVFDLVGAPDLPARAVSEGIVLVLGLFATLIGPERHRLVLVDHLERALSPCALPAFIAQLHLLLDHDPKLQIVATSDAPQLLDELAPDEVRIHTLLPEGSVAIAPLGSHPDFDLLSRDLKPGEYWRAVGEGWVADAAKAAAKAAKRSIAPAPG